MPVRRRADATGKLTNFPLILCAFIDALNEEDYTCAQEVRRMCILEYDEEKTLNGRLETGIRIGREEGRAEERAKTFKILDGFVADGLVSIKEAAKRAGVSVAEFRRLTGR